MNYYDATPSWAWLKSSNNYFTNRYNEKRYFKKVLFPVLNGKSTFLSCVPTNVDEIRSDDEPWEYIGIHKILLLLGKLPRKVDLPFRTVNSSKTRQKGMHNNFRSMLAMLWLD